MESRNVLKRILKSPRFVPCETKCTEADLKKSQICPIWGQSDLIWDELCHHWKVYTEMLGNKCVASVRWQIRLRSTCAASLEGFPMSRTGRGTFVVLRVKVATKRNIIVDYPIVIVKRSKITETKTELVGNHATKPCY